MATAIAFSASGERTGSCDLPEALFGVEPNRHVVWEAVVNFQANQRQGTAKVKSRGEISRSNSKPWRQKGTGRARAGTSRSPLWVGGGIIHGPKPRDHSYRLPRKVKRLALKSALSDRAAAERIAVIDAIELAEVKTKAVAELLGKMGIRDRKVLILTEEIDERLYLSCRNLPNVIVMPARDVNTYTVLAADWVVATKAALETLTEVFA